MEVPYFIVLLIILVQSIGVLALLLGFLTRIAAAGNFIIMVGALFVHFKNDWNMNWYGKKRRRYRIFCFAARSYTCFNNRWRRFIFVRFYD